MTRSRIATLVGLCTAALLGCGMAERPPPPRTLYTTLPHGEGVGVGTQVLMAGLPVGTVRASDSSGAGVRLRMEITRADVPLHAGASAEVRPTGLFTGDAIVIVPGAADTPALAEGAEIPGKQRLATAAERRQAMR